MRRTASFAGRLRRGLAGPRSADTLQVLRLPHSAAGRRAGPPGRRGRRGSWRGGVLGPRGPSPARLPGSGPGHPPDPSGRPAPGTATGGRPALGATAPASSGIVHRFAAAPERRSLVRLPGRVRGCTRACARHVPDLPLRVGHGRGPRALPGAMRERPSPAPRGPAPKTLGEPRGHAAAGPRRRRAVRRPRPPTARRGPGPRNRCRPGTASAADGPPGPSSRTGAPPARRPGPRDGPTPFRTARAAGRRPGAPYSTPGARFSCTGCGAGH